MRARTERLQLLCESALSQVPVPGQSRVARKAPGRTVAGTLFPCRVYSARVAGRARPTEQARDVRSIVSGYGGNLAGDCSGSPTPRGANRLFLHPAHLG